MATLPRLKPACFYDLVVRSRSSGPGPIVGQMVHPYLNRRAGREPVIYEHPSLEPVLERTLGVPLFQEQLLRMAMAVAGFTGGQAEELRRAMGFKRSEKRMRQIEVQLREGMARNGITGEAADRIVLSITSFALYGFPESHAASFALLAYASAYLKAHFPAAFYTALLNNQPMGFYHPPRWSRTRSAAASASRRSTCRCRTGTAPSSPTAPSASACATSPGCARRWGGRSRQCPGRACRCTVARPARRAARAKGVSSKTHWRVRSADATIRRWSSGRPGRAASAISARTSGPIEAAAAARSRRSTRLVRRTGLRRDEITVLAEIGALNSFGFDRRSALWQVEKSVRPSGELFATDTPEAFSDRRSEDREPEADRREPAAGSRESRDERRELRAESRQLIADRRPPSADREELIADRRSPGAAGERSLSPLASMTASERLIADYAGTSLTIGPHPIALRRHELSMRGSAGHRSAGRAAGRRVRTAGMVITRQRPGTAKGFVFLTLEDETGIANIIVRPDLYERDRLTVVESSFVLVEGILQNQEGVTAIKAERITRLDGLAAAEAVESHDFH